MGQIILSATNAGAGSPPYTSYPYRNVGTTSWSTLISSAGTHSSGGGEVNFNWYTGTFNAHRVTCMCWDLTDLNFLTFTSAQIGFSSVGNGFAPVNQFSTDSAGGAALVSVNENYATLIGSASNYNAVYRGRTTEYGTSRILHSAIPNNYNRYNYSYTLNASGLSYLNSVKSKSLNKGYAFFGIILGGVVDGIAPSASSNHVTLQSIGSMKLTLNYTTGTTGMQINVGDSWKDVAGASINVGDEWKPVSDIDINISDTWKNKA